MSRRRVFGCVPFPLADVLPPRSASAALMAPYTRRGFTHDDIVTFRSVPSTRSWTAWIGERYLGRIDYPFAPIRSPGSGWHVTGPMGDERVDDRAGVVHALMRLAKVPSMTPESRPDCPFIVDIGRPDLVERNCCDGACALPGCPGFDPPHIDPSMLALAADLKASLDIADALAVAGHPRFVQGTGRDAGRCVDILPPHLVAVEPAVCPRCGCSFSDGKIVNHACLEAV